MTAKPKWVADQSARSALTLSVRPTTHAKIVAAAKARGVRPNELVADALDRAEREVQP